MSVFKTGKSTVDVSSKVGGGFISIKDGDTLAIVPLLSLDGMIHAEFHEFWNVRPAYFHPCIGENCPSCELTDNKPRFKGYLPVQTKDDGVKIWPFTISIYEQLSALDEELDGGLGGYLVKFSRKGSGKNGTTYTVTCVGKKVDISDVEVPEFTQYLGPTNAEDIRKGLIKYNIITTSEAGIEEAGEASTDDGWGEL